MAFPSHTALQPPVRAAARSQSALLDPPRLEPRNLEGGWVRSALASFAGFSMPRRPTDEPPQQLPEAGEAPRGPAADVTNAAPSLEWPDHVRASLKLGRVFGTGADLAGRWFMRARSSCLRTRACAHFLCLATVSRRVPV